MKLATWNVAQPLSQGNRDKLRMHLIQVAADLLVLTETHDGFNPGSIVRLFGCDFQTHRYRPSKDATLFDVVIDNNLLSMTVFPYVICLCAQ